MGVLTHAGHILTAAHCLPRQPDPEYYALVDPGREQWVWVTCCGLRDKSVRFEFVVLYSDPCHDVAILSKFDPELEQHCCPPEQDPWRRLRSALGYRWLRLDLPKRGMKVAIGIWTHENLWLTGTWTISGSTDPVATIALERPDSRVEVGTSGAPVFDEEGRVLGIVNKTMDGKDPQGQMVQTVQMAVLAAALPPWVQSLEKGPHKRGGAERP
jgi:hypothetical protein